MFAKHHHRSANPTRSIIPTWPQQRQGVDIVGLLPVALGNVHFAAVALEYFTKWIEAKPLARITSGTLTTFVWQRIMCRFGIPAHITVDNGKQFDCSEFKNFYEELAIRLSFTSVNHPETNGAVERANGLIFNAIVKILFDAKQGKWAEELTTVVWEHNILWSRTTGFTPFRLLYGEEAITPEEMKLGSFRTEIATTIPLQRYVELETVENNRMKVVESLDKYHAKTKSWRDKKMLRKNINPGDMVII